MREAGMAAPIARPGRPAASPGRQQALRDKVVLVATIIVLANMVAWVMAAIFTHPSQFGHHPLRFLGWCALFACGATSVSVLARAGRCRPVPLVLMICGLDMWALLPATALLVYFTAPFIGVFVLVTLAPLTLATAAWVIVLRRRLARGAALLLVAVLTTAGGAAIFIPALAVEVWLPVIGWNLALAVAAVGALSWDLHREARRNRSAGGPQAK